jgi:hypothetical protein
LKAEIKMRLMWRATMVTAKDRKKERDKNAGHVGQIKKHQKGKRRQEKWRRREHVGKTEKKMSRRQGEEYMQIVKYVD